MSNEGILFLGCTWSHLSIGLLVTFKVDPVKFHISRRLVGESEFDWLFAGDCLHVCRLFIFLKAKTVLDVIWLDGKVSQTTDLVHKVECSAKSGLHFHDDNGCDSFRVLKNQRISCKKILVNGISNLNVALFDHFAIGVNPEQHILL